MHLTDGWPRLVDRPGPRRRALLRGLHPGVGNNQPKYSREDLNEQAGEVGRTFLISNHKLGKHCLTRAQANSLAVPTPFANLLNISKL
jgi:hypothetical protein